MKKSDKKLNELVKRVSYVRFIIDNRLNNSFDYSLFKDFCICCHKILYYWSSTESVGYPIQKERMKYYQEFFKIVVKYLNYVKKNYLDCEEIERNLIDRCICNVNTKIYRYLSLKKNEYVNYNNDYVSWSLNYKSSYLEPKFYGNVFKLCAEVSSNRIGISLYDLFLFFQDIFGMDIPCSIINEKEVVYQTIKKDIYKVEVVRRNYKSFDMEEDLDED